MKKYIIIVIVSGVFLSGAAAWLYGQTSTPSVITVKQPQPEVFVLNVPTPVKIGAVISGDVIPGSANLIRLGANGQSTVLGQLTPNSSVGSNGYSITKTFNEPMTGTIKLQLSVAIRGQLRRALSQPFLLAVSTQSITLPPDPGSAGKQTIAGVDSDNDGIRDDVFRSIVFSSPESERKRAGMEQLAKAFQSFLLATTQFDAKTAHDALGKANACNGVLNEDTKADTFDLIKSFIINTDERLRAYYKTQSLLGTVFGRTYSNPCSFNPSILSN